MLQQNSEHVIQLWQITGGLMFIGTYTEKEGLMFLALNLGCPEDSLDQYNLLAICGTKVCETLALRVFIYSTRFTASVLQSLYKRPRDNMGKRRNRLSPASSPSLLVFTDKLFHTVEQSCHLCTETRFPSISILKFNNHKIIRQNYIIFILQHWFGVGCQEMIETEARANITVFDKLTALRDNKKEA